jgi:triosephosphate isomerase
MTDAIRPLIAGNWKMNGLKASVSELEAMLAGAPDVTDKADLLVCPPVTLLASFADRARGSTAVALGAQDCHPKTSGAHTGDISAEMLADAGASTIIVGHSERRADHGESDALVRQKAEAAWRAGLVAIVCIGETQAHRDDGKTLHICGGQLEGSLPDAATAANLVVAYEPVWAIGTGRNATAAQAQEAHQHIRGRLRQWFGGDPAERCRVIYGGSVKADNISELIRQPDVDGALVGGASLDVRSFADIVTKSREAAV